MEKHDEAKTIFATQVEMTVDLISRAIREGRSEIIVWYLMSLADAASKSLAFLSDNAIESFFTHLEVLLEDRRASLGQLAHPDAMQMPISDGELDVYFQRPKDRDPIQSPDPGAWRKH